jgi:hypothetical protein
VEREWWNVICFAEREHAEKFKERFGGEWFDAKKRLLLAWHIFQFRLFFRESGEHETMDAET